MKVEKTKKILADAVMTYDLQSVTDYPCPTYDN